METTIPGTTTPQTRTSAANTPASDASANSDEEVSQPALSSDFETFLTMLTAQIQNQDPLNPIDSTDYAVQLATFSGVEQQVLTNELLENMTASENGIGSLATFANWVGMDARISGQASFDGSPVELFFDAPLGLQGGSVKIRNDAGETIASLAVDPGSSELQWDGTRSDGATSAHGSYSIRLEGKDSAGEPVTADVQSYVKVTEARLGESGAELRLKDGRIVSPDDVTALR